MRGQQTWAGVKPVLKVLQEAFPAKVHTVYILKPDNFWQKQKASLGSSKYTFEVSFANQVYILLELERHNLSEIWLRLSIYIHNLIKDSLHLIPTCSIEVELSGNVVVFWIISLRSQASKPCQYLLL